MIVSYEKWTVIDRWWTAKPQRTEWVEAKMAGGEIVVLFRRNYGKWRKYKGKLS
jgi:hypothetical protein